MSLDVLFEVRDALPVVLYPLVVDYCYTLREWHQREAEELGFWWKIPRDCVSDARYIVWLSTGSAVLACCHDQADWVEANIPVQTVVFGLPSEVFFKLKKAASVYPLEQRPRAKDPQWLARARLRASSMARR